MKFQRDILNFCDFIQVFVFTSYHHLNATGFLSQSSFLLSSYRDSDFLSFLCVLFLSKVNLNRMQMIIMSQQYSVVNTASYNEIVIA